MADIEKVLRGWERCMAGTCPSPFSQEYKDCEYTMGLYCRRDKLICDTIELLKSQQAEIGKLSDKIDGVKESIEFAILGETNFASIEDLNDYTNDVKCRSEEWIGGIRDAIFAVREWGT